jgi:N-acylneuraminate cytidylyltransferase
MRVAVIPARGGSKRIPRKNIRDFAGKPMIAHSIECALRSNLFDRVMVSTDNREIAMVAEQFGAEIPFFRPAELADDHASTTEVVAHAVEWLSQNGQQPSAVCCIYATAPFIRAEDLQKGLGILLDGKWDYVFSATSFAYPIFRSFVQKASGGMEMLFPEHFSTRSQDFPEALHDAGQFYWGRPQAWLSRTRIFSDTSTIVTVPRWRVQDIDTPDDWEQAQIMWNVVQAMVGGK